MWYTVTLLLSWSILLDRGIKGVKEKQCVVIPSHDAFTLALVSCKCWMMSANRELSLAVIYAKFSNILGKLLNGRFNHPYAVAEIGLKVLAESWSHG